MSPLRRSIALLLFIASGAMMVVGFVSLTLPGNELIPDRPSVADVAIFSLVFVTFPSVGLTLAWVRPRHPIGWLFLVVGIGIALAVYATEYAGRAAYAGADLPGAALVAWAGSWSWYVGSGIALPLAIILFPDGRLPSPRWRLLVAPSIAMVGLLVVATATQPGPIEGYHGRIQNPFGVEGPLARVAATVVPLGTAALVAMAFLAVVSLVARFRRSRGQERQQIKWLLYPGLVFLGALFAAAITPIAVAWSVALVGLAGFPLGVAVAILRHRLLDIDVVIRRTVVYTTVVGILGVVYVALVIGLGSVLQRATGGNTLAVGVSTLAIAALFGPLRGWVRGVVDRRFYRSRYDAQRTSEAFAARLRDHVELESVGRTLVSVAGEAVRPASATVWIRGRAIR